jgi:hypothetical protein
VLGQSANAEREDVGMLEEQQVLLTAALEEAPLESPRVPVAHTP